jgi:hypothetical protein
MVVSYLTKVTELKDQLVAIGTNMEDMESVSIALNGLAPSWMPFVQSVCARENFPNFGKLWDNLVPEEIKLETCSL